MYTREKKKIIRFPTESVEMEEWPSDGCGPGVNWD